MADPIDPICTTHHFRTVIVVNGEPMRVTECEVCGVTIGGSWVGFIRPCAPHHHGAQPR